MARLHHPIPSLRSNIAAFLGAVVERATSGLGSAAAAGVQQGVVVGAKEPITRSAGEMKKGESRALAKWDCYGSVMQDECALERRQG